MLNRVPKHDPFGALRMRDFRLFIIARFCITLGINSQAVCVGWQVYELTKDPFSLGLIGLAEALPFILIALYAGHIADLFDRRKIILFAMTCLVLAAGALFYFSTDLSGIITRYGTFPIYAVIFMTGIARGFFSPSSFAYMSQLVPRDLYRNSSTWNSTVFQAGAVSGPAIGGLIYGFMGISTAYLFNFSMFSVALLVLFLLPSKKPERSELIESLSQRLTSGLKFVFGNRVIFGALSLDLFAVLFGGATALLPVFAADVLYVGPEGLGILRAAPATGALLMAFWIAYKPVRQAGKYLLGCVAGFGLCMILFALSRSFVLSAFVLAIAGALDNVSVIIRSTILQLRTPDHMRGRVAAVNSVFIGSSNEIGAFESGLAARLLGLVPSVIFGGCMTLLVVRFTSRLAPQLRKLEFD